VSAADLLTHCHTLGIDLAAGEGGALLWDSDADPPAELLAALAEHKAELLILLQPPWDRARADAELAAIGARLDRALKYEAGTEARKNVLEAYRRVTAGYHGRRDPLLWEALQAVEGLLARWRASKWEAPPRPLLDDESDMWEIGRE